MDPPALHLFRQAETRREATALVVGEREYTYRELLEASAAVASHLLGGAEDLREARVAFLVAP